MKIDSAEIKKMAAGLGADLAGVASVGPFDISPKGFHPRDLLGNCKSVAVVACEFPSSAIDEDSDSYTAIRNSMAAKVDAITEEMANRLKSMEIDAVSVSSLAAATDNGRFRGPVSLKHAAEFAGLGRIGKNTLLVNEKYGNMIWIGAVLTALDLEADRRAEYEGCTPGCRLCIDRCPVSALGDECMDQMACFKHTFSKVDGQLRILCWECRKVCPVRFGKNGDKP